MKGWIREFLADVERIDLIMLGLIVAVTVDNVAHGYSHAVIPSVLASVAYTQVALLRVELKRAKRLPSNSALVTAPIEPSSDIRQFASGITQVRTALINEGNSPEQATELITAWLRSAQNP